MESNHRTYDYSASFSRIDGYLDASNDEFEDVDDVPGRDKLTYTNGFYIKYCTALFVDIRNSSDLPDKYTRPRLAKIYRSYISEVTAIINGNPDCAEVNIVGDAVYGIFNTPKKVDIDRAFESAGIICSLVNTLNCKLVKRGIDPISIGVGMDCGRVLMVQAGYSGSGLNEVVWMGKTVNDASKICHHGNATALDYPVMLTDIIYSNLNDHNKSLVSYNANRACYHANIVNTAMNDWHLANCP